MPPPPMPPAAGPRLHRAPARRRAASRRAQAGLGAFPHEPPAIARRSPAAAAAEAGRQAGILHARHHRRNGNRMARQPVSAAGFRAPRPESPGTAPAGGRGTICAATAAAAAGMRGRPPAPAPALSGAAPVRKVFTARALPPGGVVAWPRQTAALAADRSRS